MFDLKHKILASAGGILFVLLCLALWSYIGAREDRVRAETTQKEQEKAQAQIKTERDQMVQEQKAFIVEQQKKFDDLTKTFSQAQTPQQIANLAAQFMGTKQPITFVTPPATAQNPNPQPVAQVAASDAPQVKAYLQECESCKLNLETAKKQVTYEQSQHELTKQTLLSVTAERDAWKTAAHGGPFWKRFGRAMKYIGIGAGIGAVAVCGTGHCR